MVINFSMVFTLPGWGHEEVASRMLVIDRQIDRQTDRQTDRQIDRQIDRDIFLSG